MGSIEDGYCPPYGERTPTAPAAFAAPPGSAEPPVGFGQDSISKALADTAALESKYKQCVEALEFIAFNNHPAWKDRDRRERAVKTLVAIGEFAKVPPNAPGERLPGQPKT